MEETNVQIDYQAEYERVQKEFSEYRARVEAEKALNIKRGEYRRLLSEAGIPVKYHDRILRLVDFDAIALDGDALADEAAVKREIVTEWGDYAAEAMTRGIQVDTPPDVRRDNRMTVEEIMAIEDDARREREIARHHEMFGF